MDEDQPNAGDNNDPELPGFDQPFEVPEGFGPPTATPNPSQETPTNPFSGESTPTPSPDQTVSFPPPGSQPPSGQSGQFPPQGGHPPQPGQFPPPGGQPAPQQPPGQFPPQGGQPPGQYAPPAGYAAPGGGPVILDKKKSGLGCLGWGLIVGLLLLVLAGGCTFIVYRTTRAPTEAANAFMAEVQAGNYQAAANRAGSGCVIDPQALQADFAGLSDFTLVGIGISASTGQRSDGSATGTATINGTNTGLLIDLVKDGDDWRPCRYLLGPEAE